MLTKKFFKTKDEVEVTFEVDRAELESVDWACELNDWELVSMKRADRGKGPFRMKARLPKNTEVQFRYLFDGHHWENDEAADAYWPNDQGSDNSVVFTHEA